MPGETEFGNPDLGPPHAKPLVLLAADTARCSPWLRAYVVRSADVCGCRTGSGNGNGCPLDSEVMPSLGMHLRREDHNMRLIAAGLATLVLTGVASVAVATEAAAATPQFRCEKKDNPNEFRNVFANEKSQAQKDGYIRCFKIS